MSLTSPSHAESCLVGRVVTSAVTATSTTIYVQFTNSKTGAARTPQSTTLYFTFDKDNEKFEIIKASSHTTASGITTITVATNGRDLPLYGIGAGDSSGTTHSIGSQVGCVDIHWTSEILNNMLDGSEGTTGTAFKVGNEVDDDIYFYAWNADAARPYIKYDKTTNQWVYANDGASEVAMGGAGTITAGDGLTLTAGDMDIDLTDTVIFVSSSAGAGDSGKVPRLNASGLLADSFYPLALSTITLTVAEMNQLAGISANVTDTNLNTLTAGSSSDATALHGHSGATISLMAFEAITASDAVALLPIEVQYYAQLTDANLALGDSNARRKYAVKIIPSVTTSTLTTMQFRAAEAVNGATALGNLTISIQTDSAGSPSGTAVTNGTANVITQVTQRTWNTTQGSRTATWAASPTLTAGTTYHVVFEVAGTDAANYLNLSVNSAHDENFLTFTRQTYDLDTTSWGNSATNATPFFWFNTQPVLLGTALCKTDASWGGRTWNFVGFAKANISAGAFGDVYYDVVPLTGLTAGSNYYLSETAGAITTTAPEGIYDITTEPTAFTYRIGNANTSTSLKISKGQKRVIIRESTALTATTTRQYVTWFKPELVRVSATAYGTNDSAISNGVVLAGGSDTAIAMAYENAAAGTASYSGTYSGYPVMGADNLAGAGSGLTDAGFTYTYTETGTVSSFYLLEAVQ